jgi:hypothetical protein
MDRCHSEATPPPSKKGPYTWEIMAAQCSEQSHSALSTDRVTLRSGQHKTKAGHYADRKTPGIPLLEAKARDTASPPIPAPPSVVSPSNETKTPI